MLSQQVKDLYYLGLRPLTYTSHVLWRARMAGGAVPDHLRRGAAGQVWLNVGCGAHPHPSFVNIDGNVTRRPDMWLDLRNGLAFPDSSVDAIYSCHVFEHFYWNELIKLVADCVRVLRPGGGLRMLVPSLELAIDNYVKGERGWFGTFPVEYESLGGRFMNFLFCDGQHRLAFDLSLADEMLRRAGFARTSRAGWRESAVFPLSVLEDLEPAEDMVRASLVVECIKDA